MRTLSNLAVVVMTAVMLLAGAVVGSALRSGMSGSATTQAGEPYFTAAQ